MVLMLQLASLPTYMQCISSPQAFVPSAQTYPHSYIYSLTRILLAKALSMIVIVRHQVKETALFGNINAELLIAVFAVR
jgi:hypothetical protein